MNKEAMKNLALILLLGVAVFSMVRYVAELKYRLRLQDNLALAQSQATALTQEKQNLLQELGKEKEQNAQLAGKNASLKLYLKAGKERIARFFRDSAKIQNQLEETSAKFAVLKAENKALIDSHQRNYAENQKLKFKLSSLEELKKAIRELRFKKADDSGLAIKGNRGFLIRDGRSTLQKLKIEVIPAQYKSLQDSTGPTKTEK